MKQKLKCTKNNYEDAQYKVKAYKGQNSDKQSEVILD